MAAIGAELPVRWTRNRLELAPFATFEITPSNGEGGERSFNKGLISARWSRRRARFDAFPDARVVPDWSRSKEIATAKIVDREKNAL